MKQMKLVVFLTAISVAFIWAQDCTDENVTYSNCGSRCISTCKNLLGNESICPAVCVEGCFCNSGYVLDETKNKCVLENDCSPQPTEEPAECDDKNKYYTDCGRLCISTCSNPLGNQSICPDVCVEGCFCNPGYVLDETNDKCVLEEDCSPQPTQEPTSCGDDNAFYDTCGSMCVSTCRDPLGNETACPKMCIQGCFCKEGYILDEAAGKICVKERDCSPQPTVLPPQDCDDENAVFDYCGSMCVSTCRDPFGNETACPDMCVQGCFCKDGFIFDEAAGKCVQEHACSPQATTEQPKDCDDENASWNDCGSLCAETCRTVESNVTIVCPAVCIMGCFCNKGYVKDEAVDKCVVKEECSPQDTTEEPKDCADENANWLECGSFCAKTCANKNETLYCPMVCVKGCFCDEGYVLDEAVNKCVEEKECSS